MLNSGQRPHLTGYPSLTCSFAAIYHLNFPQTAPIWPCSSVGRATVICSGGRGFEPHRGQRFFLFLRVAYFLSRANAQQELFGIIRHFNLSLLKPKYMLGISSIKTVCVHCRTTGSLFFCYLFYE